MLIPIYIIIASQNYVNLSSFIPIILITLNLARLNHFITTFRSSLENNSDEYYRSQQGSVNGT